MNIICTPRSHLAPNHRGASLPLSQVQRYGVLQRQPRQAAAQGRAGCHQPLLLR